MAEITHLKVKESFIGQDIHTSRVIQDVSTTERYGQRILGYREYATSSECQPAFVTRIGNIKNAPKPTKRQKIDIIEPTLTYITERNANRRPIDVPIIVGVAVRLKEEMKK